MRDLPIRLRLAAGFAVVMALVLGTTGVFVYERTAGDLDSQIDRELAARLAGVVAIVRDDGDDLGDPNEDPLDRVDAEGVVQVIGPDGEVADATAEQLTRDPLADATTLTDLVRGDLARIEIRPPALDERFRIVAAQVLDDGVRYRVLVGATLDERDQALSSLSRLLLIGGPFALMLASLAGYGVAVGALRPVEAMRLRAAEITDRDLGQRLPVPSSRDEIAGLGTTLNQMLDRLEAGLERERRFVADASHELRTPLATLKAELDLALSRGRSREELAAALSSAAEETNRLVRLAEDLLVIARADEGRLPIQIETIDVGELLQRVGSRFATRADAKGRVAIEASPGLPVEGDRVRLEQALSNLVDNALRYGEGTITLLARKSGGSVELHVTDEGAGLPDSLLTTAHQRFSRADHVRSRGGAGLGLAIVEAIAIAHAGSARIRNVPGRGVDAWLVIPQTRSEPLTNG